jgi:hypothetical protein
MHPFARRASLFARAASLRPPTARDGDNVGIYGLKNEGLFAVMWLWNVTNISLYCTCGQIEVHSSRLPPKCRGGSEHHASLSQLQVSRRRAGLVLRRCDQRRPPLEHVGGGVDVGGRLGRRRSIGAVSPRPLVRQVRDAALLDEDVWGPAAEPGLAAGRRAHLPSSAVKKKALGRALGRAGGAQQ